MTDDEVGYRTINRIEGGREIQQNEPWDLRIFVNYDTDLHFQGHLLQELDSQTQCDNIGEYSMKIGWMVSELFFFSIQVTHFT